MRIDTNIEPISGSYHGMVFTSDLTLEERQLMSAFGEPVVDVGGDFTGTETPIGGGTISLAYALPCKYRRIYSEMPVKQIFSLCNSVNAPLQAQLYVQTVAQRIADAVNNLLNYRMQICSTSANISPYPVMGSVSVASGVSAITITGLNLSFVPKGCSITILPPTGGVGIEAYPNKDTLTKDGVVAELSATTPDANYLAAYIFF